jgi:beta-phosphoglucomutase-like phosphatase (HAD superfamily)
VGYERTAVERFACRSAQELAGAGGAAGVLMERPSRPVMRSIPAGRMRTDSGRTGRPKFHIASQEDQAGYAEIYAKFRKSVKLLPGASGVLRHRKGIGILCNRLRAGDPREGRSAALALEIAAEVRITRGQAKRAKPDPDAFSGPGGCPRYTYRESSDGWE